MTYKKVKNWRNKTKQYLVKCLGGKCNRCGYNRYDGVLDFHHIDSKKKLYTIANLLRNPVNFDIIRTEAKKCVLLCKICHGELHADLWKIDDISLYEFDESVEYPIRKKQTVERSCRSCSKKFKCGRKDSKKYCSKQCADFARRTKPRPSVDDLKKEFKSSNYSEMGRKYGVSDKTMKAWIFGN